MDRTKQDFLNQLPLVSNTNHHVYSDGRIFYKRAKDDANSSRIVLEAKVNEILGRECELVPGPPVSIVTKRFGNVVPNKEIRESFVREAMRVMQDTYYVPHSKLVKVNNLAPSLSDFHKITDEKLRHRINKKRNPEILLNIFPDLASLKETNQGLVHSDPRPANWLRQDEGTLMLIDWESALIAPWEFAVISFVSYLFEYGRPDLAHFAIEEAKEHSHLDKRMLAWSANFRTASISSWYFAYEGSDSGMEWMNKLSQFWLSLQL